MNDRIRRANDLLERARGLVVEAKHLAYHEGDAGACGAIDAAYGALSTCRVVPPGGARLGQPDRPAAAVAPVRQPTPADRYLMDVHFHVLVDFLRGTLAEGNFTVQEIREAATLAGQVHEAHTIRPLFWTGGGPFEG